MNMNKEVARESLKRGVPVYAWSPFGTETPICVQNAFDLDAVYPGAVFRDATGHLLGQPKPQPPPVPQPAGVSDLSHVDWLRDLLANGPVLSDDIFYRGRKSKRSAKALRLAQKKIGAVAFQKNRAWYWAMPADVPVKGADGM
jgi:hypothetical protein